MILRRRVERAAAVAMFTVVATAAAAQPPLDTLLARLGDYLLAYETELSTLVADESLVQETAVATFSSRSLIGAPEKRVLQSDVMFLRLPGEGPWLGYRDVRRVDNTDVDRTGPRILDLLKQPTRDNQALARNVAYASARYNLGAARTINVPTLPLELMHPRNRHRFTFRAGGRARIAGINTTAIHFEERVRPSLVQTPFGADDMLSKGTVWIDAGNGRLLRGVVSITFAETKQTPLDWTLRVDFVENQEFGLLVPAGFEERFFVQNKQIGTEASTRTGQSRARYSNFRRFTTSARIVPQ